MEDETIKVIVEDTGDAIRVTEIHDIPLDDDDDDELIEEVTDFNRPSRKPSNAASVAGQVGQFYFSALMLPLNLLPDRARYHAKNSIREGFLSFKALVEEVNTAIDDGLARSINKDRQKVNASTDYADTIDEEDDSLSSGVI